MDKMKKKICIIGCGTFGSYLLKRLLEKHGDGVEITVVEIGNRKPQNEQEIGLDSIAEHSKVSRDGRYFGFGGTSARWGGQVLFFDERDNPEGDETWNEIVRINHRHKSTVLKNLLGENVDLQEDRANIKTGIWLKYAKRNLFNRLSNSELSKVNLMPDQRVVDFKLEGERIAAVVCRSKLGQTTAVAADTFYLTAGALESCRLLLTLQEKTGLLEGTDLGKNFGDHISTELFTVHRAKPVFNGVDFTPQLRKGSLVTQRMVVQTDDGVIGFLHCVFNKDIKAFKFLKELMFGKRSTSVTFPEFISGIVFLFRFVFHLLFKHKLYVDENQWSVQLDMEQPVPNNNSLHLSSEQDIYGEAILQIDWNISKKDLAYIAEMRKKSGAIAEK